MVLAGDQRGAELGTRCTNPVGLPGHCRGLDAFNLREVGTHWRVCVENRLGSGNSCRRLSS